MFDILAGILLTSILCCFIIVMLAIICMAAKWMLEMFEWLLEEIDGMKWRFGK